MQSQEPTLFIDLIFYMFPGYLRFFVPADENNYLPGKIFIFINDPVAFFGNPSGCGPVIKWCGFNFSDTGERDRFSDEKIIYI